MKRESLFLWKEMGISEMINKDIFPKDCCAENGNEPNKEPAGSNSGRLFPITYSRCISSGIPSLYRCLPSARCLCRQGG